MNENEEIVFLNLSNKNLDKNLNILSEITQNFPNLKNIDISNNNLKNLPNEILKLEKLEIINISNNNFENIEILIENLLKLKNLHNIKINKNNLNENELLLFENIQSINVEDINEEKNSMKSIKKENLFFIDLNEEDLPQIDYQNNLKIIVEIFNLIKDRYKSINYNINFENEFKEIMQNEVKKINEESDNIPNYIYNSKLIQSIFNLMNFLIRKLLFFLEIRDEVLNKIIKLLKETYFNNSLILVSIINKMYELTCNKALHIQNNIKKAIKFSQNYIDEINNFNQIYEDNINNKNVIINHFQNELNSMNNKIIDLKNENHKIFEKYINLSKNFSNYLCHKIDSNENINKSNDSPIESKNLTINYNLINKEKKDNSIINSNNSNNNNENNLIIKNYNINNNNNKNKNFYRVFTIKMMKKFIKNLYKGKTEFDLNCEKNCISRPNMEEYLYIYLNNKYGLKKLIIEWVTNILNGLEIFSKIDSEIFLFGKILKNQIEENFRFFYDKLKNNIKEGLILYYKNLYPLKTMENINLIIKERKKNYLLENEWKNILHSLYNSKDSNILEKKISYILKNNNLIYENELQENKNINIEIKYKDFVQILHEFHIKSRENFLKNFTKEFNKVDTDNNGIINEDEFVSLIFKYKIYNSLEFSNKSKLLLKKVAKFDKSHITYSDCIEVFSKEKYNNELNLLEKMCLNEYLNENDLNN